MGPQLYRCGDGYMGISVRNTIDVLQWGRNFIVAEDWSWNLNLITAAEQLQWGRNFIVGGDLANIPMVFWFRDMLQWGRNFIVAETCWC